MSDPKSTAFGVLAIKDENKLKNLSTNGDVKYKPTIIMDNGKLNMTEFTSVPQFNNKLKDKDVDWMISGGSNCPLVVNGKASDKSAFANNASGREQVGAPLEAKPRTMLGYQKDGSVVMVVVDGGTKSNAGATGVEAAKIMQHLNCKNAILLDGNGSSQLVKDKKLENKPIPDTINGKKEVRKVANAILVQSK